MSDAVIAGSNIDIQPMGICRMVVWGFLCICFAALDAQVAGWSLNLRSTIAVALTHVNVNVIETSTLTFVD